MVVRTCDIKLIFINYSQSNAVNASYLTDFVQNMFIYFSYIENVSSFPARIY